MPKPNLGQNSGGRIERVLPPARCMSADGILTQSARAQVRAVASGQITCEALMEASLSRVAEVNQAVNAVVAMRETDALLAQARAMDKAGPVGPLAGLPTAIKDLHNAKGLANSQGSPIFAGEIAEQDDPHVARMRAAGAIFTGKTNVPEFGFGGQSYNPVFGITRNPYAPHLTAGGSSGGAAAALAAGMMAIADGSDAMGSLRNPAAWCNVYGMRPTRGLVPGVESGDIYLHKLSTRGPMARDPGDMALLLGVMTGDVTTGATDYDDPQLGAEVRRIGWLSNWGGTLPIEPGILTLCETALGVLEGAHARITPVAPPVSRELLWDAWTDLRSFTTAAEMRELYADEATRAQLKPEIIWEIERGLKLSAMDVHDASVRRSDWYRAAMTLFDQYDILALPSAQVWPFDAEQHWPRDIAGQAMDTYHRWMEVVIAASLLGLPVISVPVGFGDGGLPMGMQLIGRRGADRMLLYVAEAYHRATEWPQRHPPNLGALREVTG